MKNDKETKKLDYNNFEEAKELFLRFRDKYLHGNIDELANFSFWEISGDSDFDGTCFEKYSPKFDGDKTRIIYAIDRLIYNDKNLPNFSEPFGVNYSGETINTFNTLFSSRKNWRETILKKFNLEERKSIFAENATDDFYHIYQRLGNFMLLPCKTLCHISINSYRGVHPEWKDYFYPFMTYLEKSYEVKDFNFYSDKSLYELSLLRKENDFFFAENSFNNFMELFDLQNFNSLELRKYLKRTELFESAENREIALDYVKKAKEFIKNRTEVLLDKLKVNLNK